MFIPFRLQQYNKAVSETAWFYHHGSKTVIHSNVMKMYESNIGDAVIRLYETPFGKHVKIHNLYAKLEDLLKIIGNEELHWEKVKNKEIIVY